MLPESHPHHPTILDTVDEFIAAVPWTKNRQVLVFRRTHGGRSYVRLRTFNRHKTKGCWYPTSRCFVVPEECAFDLAEAIQAAAEGDAVDAPPDWFHDFEKQYEQYQAQHGGSTRAPWKRDF